VSIIIINPNSTESMTEAMVDVARQAEPSLELEGWTSHDGPPSIQGAADGAAATPPLLELVRNASARKARGIIIGCFDDTALFEAAKIADCPVLGIGQASYHYAALRNWRFSVVTTLQVSVPVIEDNISDYGLARHLARVRASDVPVLELENDLETAERMILAESRRAENDDSIDALILGCAGMVHVTKSVHRSLNIAVLDPVSIASSCMAWMVHSSAHRTQVPS